MKMTKNKPVAPGWYWYELPGSWALQPVFVFNGGADGLMYTLGMIGHDEDEDDLDGFWLSNASDDAMWSDAPIVPPNASFSRGPSGPSAGSDS